MGIAGGGPRFIQALGFQPHLIGSMCPTRPSFSRSTPRVASELAYGHCDGKPCPPPPLISAE